MAETALSDKFWLWIVALAFCMPLRTTAVGLLERWMLGNNWFKDGVFFICRIAVSVTIVILSVALLVGATNNAFIYTRF
jgi:alginate O-acetyltransferase complex protein AlgI